MLDIIWGLKTHAMMDVWTIEHLLSGISVGHAVRKNNHKVFEQKMGIEQSKVTTRHFDLLGVGFAAYAWEAIEHYLEEGIAGEAAKYWFQGVEFWPNRIIFDPAMLVIGYLIAKKYPRLVIPARFLSLTWLFVHIFIFPHSMYLHELFSSFF